MLYIVSTCKQIIGAQYMFVNQLLVKQSGFDQMSFYHVLIVLLDRVLDVRR